MPSFSSEFFTSKKSREGALHVAILLAKIWLGNWCSSRHNTRAGYLSFGSYWHNTSPNLCQEKERKKKKIFFPKLQNLQSEEKWKKTQTKIPSKKTSSHLNCLQGFGSVSWVALLRWKWRVNHKICKLQTTTDMHSPLCITCRYLDVQQKQPRDIQNQRFSSEMQTTISEVLICNTNMLPIGQVQRNITWSGSDLRKLAQAQWSGDSGTSFFKGRIKSPRKY